MTTDTKTTLLPAARLAEIRLRDSGEEAAEAIADYDQPTIDRRALLAHIDALTAPAQDDGGEALGLAIFAASDMQAGESAEDTAAEWARLLPDARAEMIRQGLALDAHGYARGFAAGADLANETTRHLIEARDLAQRTAEIAHAEIARLTAALRTETTMKEQLQDQLEERRLAYRAEWERAEGLTAELAGARRAATASIVSVNADRDRLTAELAEARAAVESFQRGSGCIDGYTIGEALAKIGASLDRTPTEGIPDAIARLKRAAETARREGARDEREACIADMRGECDDEADHEFMIRAAERIIRRAHAAADNGRETSGEE